MKKSFLKIKNKVLSFNKDIFKKFRCISRFVLYVFSLIRIGFIRIKKIINKIRNFSIYKMLEPKNIIVKNISFYAIKIDSNLTVEKIKDFRLNNKCGIQEAINEVNFEIESLRNKSILPIVCIDKLNVYLGGVKIFLANFSNESLFNYFSGLNLYEPFNFKVLQNGAVTNAILDFNSERVLILGKSSTIISTLKQVIERFYFTNYNKSYISNRISYILKNYTTQPLGTNMLIAAFGTIYAFVVGIFINKIVNNGLSIGLLASIIGSLSSYIWWLTIEAFENSIVAISPRWTVSFSKFSWFTFLIILMVGPVYFLGSFVIADYIPFIKTIATLNIFSSIIRTMGEVFYEKGLSKKITIYLWLAFLLVIHLSEILFKNL